ncbi:MAG: hypothetical protein AB1861_08655 [Cyanobacteriota bacterium]
MRDSVELPDRQRAIDLVQPEDDRAIALMYDAATGGGYEIIGS